MQGTLSHANAGRLSERDELIMTVDARTAFDFHLFVSYSHHADYRLTRRIEAFLESFHTHVPKRSRDRLTPLNICVDGSDFRLPPRSSADLATRNVPDVIVENLARSKELLVLCSETAARSPWVSQEIAWFVEHRGPQSIRLALTEGDRPLGDAERYFAPSLLEHGLHRNICYDLRGLDRRRARGWSVVADFDRELVRLAGDLNGLAAGDVYPLWLEEDRRRTRRLALSATSAACLILAGVAYGITERSGRQVAEANRRAAEAQTALARTDALQKESARQAEEERRKAADANARAQRALRLASDAFERLYRAPSDAVRLARESQDLQPSDASNRALADAYRVAIYRNENRRQARRLTGSGPGYLASRWSENNLSSVISSDGRYLVVITPRGRDGVTGPDGKPMPGDLYLIDNETQRPVQLENCRTSDITRRAEYVGFDAAVHQVIVTRHYNLMTYSLRGDCLGTVLLECCTKSPIQLVQGYFANRYLIAADTKGGLWLAEPSSGRVIQVRNEFAGDTVTAIEISGDGSRAVVISESGRATLLTLNGARPAEVEIARTRVIAAAFHPQDSGTVALTGIGGLAQIWQTRTGRPALGGTFLLPPAPIDSVTFTADGSRVVAIADNRRLYVLQTGLDQPLATLDYPIDWSESRKVPNHFAQHRPANYDLVADAGDRIPFPDAQLLVNRVESVDGRTWLFSVRKPDDVFSEGPAFLVDGSIATALPDRDTNVSRVEGVAGSTWLHTSEGLYQLTSRGIRLALPPKTIVFLSAQIGPDLWFGTNHGAWRVQGESIARFTPTNVEVTDIRDIDGKIWITSRTGAFRLDPREGLLRVTDEGVHARRVVKVRGRIWILTGSDSEPGPALLVRDLWTRALPEQSSRVEAVVHAGGQTWLLSNRGLFRVEGDRAKAIAGITAVADVKEVGGKIVATQKTLLGDVPTFAIRGDRAVRVPAAAGVDSTRTDSGLTRSADATPWLLSGGQACMAGNEPRRCFHTPGREIVGVRHVRDAWWLLTRQGIFEPGPAYRIDGDVAKAVPDETLSVSDVRDISGETWFVTRRDGRPGPLQRAK